MFTKSKLLLFAVVSIIIIALGYCGYKVHAIAQQQQQVKQDYATANDITFGLLSVSQWRDQIVKILSKEIEGFDFSPEQRQNLQKEINDILNALVNRAIGIVEHPQKKGFKGKLIRFAFNTFVDSSNLYKQVPGFTKTILAQVENPANKQRLKSVAQSKLDELGQQTYDSSQNEQKLVIDTMYHRYKVSNAADFQKRTDAVVKNLEHDMDDYAFGMLACVLLILAIWFFVRKKDELHPLLYMLSILSALIILLVGLTTVMIEVDARISALDFYLLGDSISFKNQVLFFQAKSIVDVVKILLETGKYDSILVGALLLCFSIMFPILKLLSASIYLFGTKKWTKGGFIHFFAFKSGKWSMADVMVVGILMTYIGFNGILESQLAVLNMKSDSLVSITTNNTSLQPGYIVFVAFVLYSLVLSQILKNITGKKQE